MYAFTGEQVQQIFTTLRDELDKAQKRYTQSYEERFSLSEGQSAALTELPTVVLPLPDGSRLRAVAYGGDSFPAINIYWDTDLHNFDGPICFAEYNPERSPATRFASEHTSLTRMTLFITSHIWQKGIQMKRIKINGAELDIEKLKEPSGADGILQ